MKLDISHGRLRGTVETHGGELISFRDTARDGRADENCSADANSSTGENCSTGESCSADENSSADRNGTAAGTEYIWNGDPKFWTGRNPVLFPIVGNLKNGTVEIDGASYHMNRHGFARNMEFTVADRGADFAVLELCENPETLACYPFHFTLRVCHRILENGFSTSFYIKNTDEKHMPFCIGAHTAFNCPLREGEQFSDYRVVFDKEEHADLILLTPEGLISADKRMPYLNGADRFTPDYGLFGRIDTIIFDNLKSTGMSLVHSETGRGVHMDFKGFPMAAFWTKPGAPYLCLEPWHGCAAIENESGHFEDKPHCIILAPGEEKTLSYTVTLL